MKNIPIPEKLVEWIYQAGEFTHKIDQQVWQKENKSLLTSLDLKIEKQYMWYTTCPKCAKKYGENYVVIVGEIKE